MTRRLDLDDGTSGELVPAGAWSWLVRNLTGPSPAAWLDAAAEQAATAGVLDLRSPTPLPGTTALTDHEHVRPVAVTLPDLAATRALGRRLAGHLRAGDLVVLDGPLGAGKTSLTQGVGAQLGVRGAVTSPTFVLAREHRGPLPLVHVDAYRLQGAARADLDDLELDLALESAVVVVEWGAGMVESVAASHLLVRLERPPGADVRRAAVHAYGPRWAVVQPHSITARTQGGPQVAAPAALRLDAREARHSPQQQERCE